MIIVGLIHLLPLAGVTGTEKLTALYGIPISGPDMEILLRHRAVLFGLFGGFIIYAALNPKVRMLGIIAGFLSVISFLVLARLVGGYNESIQRVFAADVAAFVLLCISLVLTLAQRSSQAE